MLKHFLNADTDVKEKLDEGKRTICFFRVPYIDKESRRFVISLSRLVASRYNIKLYTTFAASRLVTKVSYFSCPLLQRRLQVNVFV